MQSVTSTQKRTIANMLSSVVYEENPDAPCEQNGVCTIAMPELVVPPTPPSGLIGVQIITLTYDVMVSKICNFIFIYLSVHLIKF